ncbi:MAG: preprotein translocase subunit YajC [Spirochaetaceae bacterium]|nr:MAG: preprotein translocase subunit YajC [Spirochaetaceae bacterium]
MATIFHNLPLLMAPPAGGAQGGPASIVPTLVTFGLVFLIFYFLIIRPQSKRQKETKQMLSQLRKGDRVVTIGGMRGTIQSLKEDSVVLKVDSNTSIEFNRSAIGNVVDKRSGSKPQKEKDTTEDASDEE